MRRVVEPSRILFVDRHRGWALLLFGASVCALLLAEAAHEREGDPARGEFVSLALAGSGALFLGALWALFRKRILIIDREAQSLSIIEHRLTGRTSCSYPLGAVSVKLEVKVLDPWASRSAMKPRRDLEGDGGRSAHVLIVGAIWIQTGDRQEVPFLDDLRGPEEGRRLATQLAADLGSPLHVIEREYPPE